VAKTDLGTKRVCPDTGRKFYDLNKTPVISPYTGKIVPITVAPVRAKPEAPAAVVRPAPVEEVEAIANSFRSRTPRPSSRAKSRPLPTRPPLPAKKKRSKSTRASTMPPSSRKRKKAMPMCRTSSARRSRRKRRLEVAGRLISGRGLAVHLQARQTNF